MKLIDTIELAEIIDISPQKIRELCEAQIIPHYNMGLGSTANYKFQINEVLAALKNRKKGE